MWALAAGRSLASDAVSPEPPPWTSTTVSAASLGVPRRGEGRREASAGGPRTVSRWPCGLCSAGPEAARRGPGPRSRPPGGPRGSRYRRGRGSSVRGRTGPGARAVRCLAPLRGNCPALPTRRFRRTGERGLAACRASALRGGRRGGPVRGVKARPRASSRRGALSELLFLNAVILAASKMGLKGSHRRSACAEGEVFPGSTGA